ncbi:unnamed protein product, partial [Discosporangium mesarthrocarpum]
MKVCSRRGWGRDRATCALSDNIAVYGIVHPILTYGPASDQSDIFFIFSLTTSKVPRAVLSHCSSEDLDPDLFTSFSFCPATCSHISPPTCSRRQAHESSKR